MKLWCCFQKDMKLSLRGFYFYTEIIMAFVFIAIMIFVVPENMDSSMKIYMNLEVNEMLKPMIQSHIDNSEDEIVILDSEKAVKEAIKEDRSSVGLSVVMKDNSINYNFILQGYENEKFRNIIKTSFLNQDMFNVDGYKSNVSTITLEDTNRKLSVRLNTLPVFLTLNAGFMGLFIIAAYIFLDKKQGTIRALVVAPIKVWQYLGSKVMVLLVTGLASGLITTVFLAGTKANYLHLIALLITTNIFGSALGLLIASFFNNLQKAMGWLYMFIILMTFGGISYYVPAFSQFYIKLLPSYPMLFAFREVFLDNPNINYIYSVAGIFLLAGIILFILANNRFKKTLTV